MQVTFRPLPTWPHPATPEHARRSRWTFKASWKDTLRLLETELVHLNARDVLFGVSLEERDIRLDGLPRADARPFRHPGVELSFDSRFGRLTYATDAHELWPHGFTFERPDGSTGRLSWPDLPLGAALGIVRLVDVKMALSFEAAEALSAAGVADPLSFEQPAALERELGDYTSGRWAWLLADPEPFPEPVPATGRLGLWDFEGGA